jgi:hypothetical protein
VYYGRLFVFRGLLARTSNYNHNFSLGLGYYRNGNGRHWLITMVANRQLPICHQVCNRGSIENQQHLSDANATGNVALLRSRPTTWFTLAGPRWRIPHDPRRVIAQIGFGKRTIGHVIISATLDYLSVSSGGVNNSAAITLPMLIGHTSLTNHNSPKS